MSDMEAVQKRMDKVKVQARGGADKKAQEEYAFLERLYSFLESEKCYIICVPTYAWRIPGVVTQFLEQTELKGSTDIYFVMTCGGEIGKAEKYNLRLCNKIGKAYKGTSEIKMPENYIAMFDATDEEGEKLLMRQADTALEKTAQAISGKEALPEVKAGASAFILSGAVNGLFYSLFVKDKKFLVKDNCISCGICAKKCPLNNIDIKEGKPIWKGNCTHCMACISYCPEEAIEYGNKSRGQRRYRCRSYK